MDRSPSPKGARNDDLAPPIVRTPIGSPPVSVLDREPVAMQGDWVDIRRRRANVTRFLTILVAGTLVTMQYQIMTRQGMSPTAVLGATALYAVMTWFLFGSFVKSVWGWLVIRLNHNLADHPENSAVDPAPDTRVAVIFPVYHEDVARVAGGMAAAWESLERNVPAFCHQYDIFLLSDSRKASFARAEAEAVRHLRATYPGGRFYYRLRRSNTHAKIGNITDFCRRWGGVYKYMFTMDADSIVSGATIHETLRMMEGRASVGILQTNPKAVFRQTVFGRMQQFAGNIFGRVFAASIQATMLGNALYMGHNAMVRIKPFIDHCILPSLSGKAPWGGKPLSHDIVESALMAANGYETWFLPELGGSWEEIPANILASLIRERRWMQGNLQHSRLIGARTMTSAYREYYVNGMFSYLSAPTWAVFLVVSTLLVLNFIKQGVLDPETAMQMLFYMSIVAASTLVVFLSTRLMAIGSVFDRPIARTYGGKVNILVSVVIEFVFSMLYSPIVMMMMSKFIYLWARKKTIVWDVQDRGDSILSWRDCFRHFGWMSITGTVVAAGMIYYATTIPEQDADMMMAVSSGYLDPYILLYWMAPVLCGIIFAPCIVRWTSQPVDFFRDRKMFLIPEEYAVPPEFKTVAQVESRFRILLPSYA